ncbi:VOC family protein [Pendulispora albinea]|uniref:VOC family protein n=1 Tax=Pendulispora albinea TaxID=2741071 RepID=A0ABZ2M8X5_9BACT
MSKELPEGWPRISASLFYDDGPGAIDWLCRAFGFQVRLKIEGDDGSIVHSELEYREGVIMASSSSRCGPTRKSPRALEGVNTQSLFMYVDDVEAHCQRARAAGATIVTEPATTNYGDEYHVDRGYSALDCEGHLWYFAQRLRGSVKGA